uniref:DExD-box helicase 52 n=1 Tax=Equus caballus TaxID=9796 RepID=A0A9L0SYH2_HORSE
MDAHDLFRRLGAGAKFDVRRFSADAARFQVGKRKYDFGSSEVLQGLDFFGNKSVPGECGASRTHQELQDEEKKESLSEGKREQNKKKRKKMTSDKLLPE